MNNAYIRAQQCKVKEAKFPFVKIGSQYWTTKNLSLAVTPQGNLIPEIQANGNVEKITNQADREFSSGTGFWTKGIGWEILNGEANANASAYISLFRSVGSTIAGKWYKTSFDITSYMSGGVKIVIGGTAGTLRNSVGTYAQYIYGGNGVNNFDIRPDSLGFVGSIDNVSIQEIGWSGSQELYDGIYAQTSGTVEQKTYAAVKAASMWSNYNNDPVLGGIYGKLYNWFAVKLFQMDIDYYNAANPTKPYIWRMPTQAEFQTLSNFLGGDAVSGGHLKEAGLEHWNSPNMGADNSSGFSALGGGYRSPSGPSSNINVQFRPWSITEINNTTANCNTLESANTTLTANSIEKTRGNYVRLIKA